jgi:Gas vesicle synthesis protein GvpL/GvpF
VAILLYCVTTGPPSTHSQPGVAGSLVSRLEHSGLTIFFSENSTTDLWLKTPLSKSANEFHRVQQEIFRGTAIIPFRFPTILEDGDKLRAHLEERSGEYRSLLARFASFVQIDITVTQTASSPPPSGAEYLRERQGRNQTLDEFTTLLRSEAGTLAKDWRQRSIANGLRCFALIERNQIQEFNERMKTVSMPSQLSARVSGPWPVAEFLDFKS